MPSGAGRSKSRKMVSAPSLFLQLTTTRRTVVPVIGATPLAVSMRSWLPSAVCRLVWPRSASPRTVSSHGLMTPLLCVYCVSTVWMMAHSSSGATDVRSGAGKLCWDRHLGDRSHYGVTAAAAATEGAATRGSGGGGSGTSSGGGAGCDYPGGRGETGKRSLIKLDDGEKMHFAFLSAISVDTIALLQSACQIS
jgi:hypothetical protein